MSKPKRKDRLVKELMDLKGRVALITGGTGHIGFVMCEALAEMGASIAVLDLDEGSCKKAATRLSTDHGIKAIPLAVDLGNEALVKSVPQAVVQDLGGLDILVNCAALVGTSSLKGWTSPFLEQESEPWRKALEINLTAPFILTQAAAPALATSGNGSVINVGSVYGVVGPDMRLYADSSMGNPAGYAASKGGLIQLTRWLASVLAPAIRVNAISFGGMERGQPAAFEQGYIERSPMKRMATEEDAKGSVVFLASDLSAYVTGQNLMVDGGFTSW